MLAERGFDPRTSGLWAQQASIVLYCHSEEILRCLPQVKKHLVVNVTIVLLNIFELSK